MFSIYPEPLWIPDLLSALTLLLSFFIWFTPLFLLKNSYISKDKNIISFISVVFLAIFIVVLNYYLDFQSLLTILICYIATILIMFYTLKVKSIKWIHISLLTLLLTILCIYCFMNYKFTHISYLFFNLQNIPIYEIEIHKHLTIYKPGNELGNIYFYLNGHKVTVVDQPFLFRIFGVYTGLNCVTFIVWLSVYKTILKYHKK